MMQAWLESLAPGYGPALMWTVAALIGLLILLVLIRIVRGLTFGTFVSGGRNRKARLAVMDATAVDSHRRLVLVRRDDVEHLILIGGPSDVVVEQNIRLLPATRRPAAGEPVAERPPAHHPEPAPRPVQQAPKPAAPAPAPPPPRQPAPPPPPAPRPVPPVAAPPPVAPPPARPSAPPVPPQTASVQTLRPVSSVPAGQQPARPDLDEALLEELEVTLEKDHTQQAATAPSPDPAERSLDEEMSKLLSDLSAPRR